jgi:bifunctional DNase/RNase
MTEMVEVVIDSVRVSLMSPQRVVILRQRDAERYLPIWVGPAEAESITVALQEVELARPMTHDLLKSLLVLFNAILLRVEIVALKEDIFYGSLVIERDGRTVDLDSRPSDAIALAVRSHAPILVSREVMDEAGIAPEKDMQPGSPEDTQPLPPPEQASGPAPADEKRQDVFEDFLKKLGDDKSGDKTGKS